MSGKIKKVLVSLTLASILAIAPMNVSAENPKITNNGPKAQTSVNYVKGDLIKGAALKKAAVSADYVIEVPESISFSESKLEENMDLKLLNNDVKKDITVTPSFAPNNEKYSNLKESDLSFKESVSGEPHAKFKSDADLNSVQTITATLTEDGKNAIEEVMGEDSSEAVVGQINYAVELAEAGVSQQQGEAGEAGEG